MISFEAKELAAEAKRKEMWLFDPTYRKWYSPEDFLHIFQYANAPQDFLKQLQLRHPVEGVQAGFKRLNEIQSKLDAFSRSVIDYYKKKSR